jgi:hypothetical protein
MKIHSAVLEPLHVDIQTDMAALGATFLVLLAYQCAEA